MAYIKTKQGREFWDRTRIKLPIFGHIAHKICLARFTRTLASLVRSGVPILEVLSIVANTCAERINVPGYGTGLFRKAGWFGLERHRWGRLFGLRGEELDFFELHEQADIEHSNQGWHAVERYARELRLEDAVVNACERNLHVWEHYLNGIAAAGDAYKG